MTRKKPCLLSTKTLPAHQKVLLQQAGFELLEKNFITISFREFTLKKTPDILLFTSQNAVKSVLKNQKADMLKNIPAICVGSKTKQLLENHGFKVLFFKSYAKELTTIISKFTDHHLAFFAGNLRMKTLPEFMKSNPIQFEEYLTYNTQLSPKIIQKKTDGILFFSPSGIKSYLQKNSITHQKCFCIGTTTAEALTGITPQVFIADKQTIAGTIETCVLHFKPIL